MIRTRAKRAQQVETAPEVYPAEGEREETADHGFHVTDATCARCSQTIKPNDEVRKTLKGECVHIAC